ncbi:type IV pilus modification PilV family protein [Microbacterium sp. P5_E9]
MNRRSNEDGVSLIELVVYVLLLAIVMSAVAVIFVNTWKAQQSVTAQTRATTRGQLVSSEVERAMRNAIAFDLSPDGTTLKVQTSLTGEQECQGFYFSGHEVRMIVKSSPITKSPDQWNQWQSGIDQDGVTAYLQPLSTRGVRYTFQAAAPAAPVRFTGETYMRNSVAGTVAPCW